MKDLQIDDSVLPAATGAVEDQPRQEHDGRARSSSGPQAGAIAASRWSKIYEKYVEGLRDNGALDFDDLLLKAVELLDKVPHVRDRYAEKFRFVMVDEYQDTNRPQYHLIQRLSQRHRNLVRRRATPISRSIDGAAPTCATSWTSSTIFPKRRS